HGGAAFVDQPSLQPGMPVDARIDDRDLLTCAGVPVMGLLETETELAPGLFLDLRVARVGTHAALLLLEISLRTERTARRRLVRVQFGRLSGRLGRGGQRRPGEREDADRRGESQCAPRGLAGAHCTSPLEEV